MFARLNELNLNLLVALDVLLEERSVSLAAARLGCSQPAASARLSQLREALEDPLLVREGRHLVRTPRADALVEPVRAALSILDDALAPEAFDPETATGVVRIGSRFDETTFWPSLAEHLHGVAPGLDLHLRDLRAGDLHADLRSGEVDLVVQPQSHQRVYGLHQGRETRLQDALYFQRLWDEGWVCVVRQDHPIVKARVDVETFAGLDHVLVSPRGDGFGFVDSALGELGLHRRVARVVPNVRLACLHVSRSHCVLTTHPGVLDSLVEVQMLPLKRVAVPLALPTAIVSMVWHERTHTDAKLRWVRKQLFELTRFRREHGCSPAQVETSLATEPA